MFCVVQSLVIRFLLSCLRPPSVVTSFGHFSYALVFYQVSLVEPWFVVSPKIPCWIYFSFCCLNISLKTPEVVLQLLVGGTRRFFFFFYNKRYLEFTCPAMVHVGFYIIYFVIKRCHITPLLLHNGQFSTPSFFHCLQAGRFIRFPHYCLQKDPNRRDLIIYLVKD